MLFFEDCDIGTIDDGLKLANDSPYGGRKDSGYEHGKEGLHEYLKTKHVRLKTGF